MNLIILYNYRLLHIIYRILFIDYLYIINNKGKR
jgi:hypothetical protein